MANNNAPSTSAVSAFMGKKFNRSDSSGMGPASQGYRASRGFGHHVREVDWVAVEFIPGWLVQHTYGNDPAGLLEVTQAVLSKYAKHLEQRYDIARNDEGGSDDWNCLLVRKKESAL